MAKQLTRARDKTADELAAVPTAPTEPPTEPEPQPEGRINITFPTGVEVKEGPATGVIVDVIGNASLQNADITGVSVQLGTGARFLAAKSESGKWLTWSFSGKTTIDGPLVITAKLTGTYRLDPRGTVQRFEQLSEPVTITTRIDGVAPILTISEPVNGVEVPVPETTDGGIFFKGTAFDAKTGVSVVEASVDGSEFTRVGEVTPGWGEWRFALRVPFIGTRQVAVRAVDRVGNATPPLMWTVHGVDRTAPTLEISSPQNGDPPLPWHPDGTPVPLAGTASDPRSGVQSVEWRLDNGPFTQAETTTEWSSWHKSVLVRDSGKHTITVRCRDKAGNESPAKSVALEVKRIAVPTDPKDNFSLLAYLKDLVDYVGSRVVHAGTQTNVTKQELAQVFQQPFDQLRDLPADDPRIEAAVRTQLAQIRVAIEVLRAFLRASGSPTPTGAWAEAEKVYRQAAYQTLLVQHGTTYDEVRLIRNAEYDARKKLTDRLGIPPREEAPDDRLFMAPNDITEAALEQLFGLRSTTRDPLTSPTSNDLLSWQRAYLKALWKAEDHPETFEDDAPPMIDPDQIMKADLSPTPVNADANTLWEERRGWIVARLEELANVEPSAPAKERFTQIVKKAVVAVPRGAGTTWPAVTEVDLLQLDERRARGERIDADLANIPLSSAAFSHLIRLHKLAQTNAMLPAEWSDLYSILVQVQKERKYSAWRTEEREKAISLSPDYFTIPDLASTSAASPAPSLPAWRATARARRSWQDKLRGRIGQERALVESIEAAVAATEIATLPALRDALVRAAGGSSPMADVGNALTDRLVIDVMDSGVRRTTRIAQAVETLQGILFSLRSGRWSDPDQPEAGTGSNPAADWALENEAIFDEEWRWLGSYDSWRAAWMVFVYPDNLLLPSLRENATMAFKTLTATLRGSPRLTPERQRLAIDAYLKELKDEVSEDPLVPDENSPDWLDKLTDIPGQLDDAGLEARRTETKQLLEQFPNQPQRGWVDEVYYAVPMQMALHLQQVGQYIEALDWFRTVYAYDLPPDKRKTYYGLVLDEQGSDVVQLPEDQWLQESLNPHTLAQGRAHAYTRFTLMSLIRSFLAFADAQFAADSNESNAQARDLYVDAGNLLRLPILQPGSGTGTFTENPVPKSLRTHANLNLFKLRDGRNIAGVRRQVDPPTVQRVTTSVTPVPGSGSQVSVPASRPARPTPYRYATLIDRAKQLIAIAQQIEASFLAALEKQDIESYNLLRARQDLRLSQDGIELHQRRVTEATDGIELAQRQFDRAEQQAATLEGWIATPISDLEQEVLDDYAMLNSVKSSISAADSFIAATQAMASAASGTGAGIPFAMAILLVGGVRHESVTKANALETGIQTKTLRASYERRENEWRLQKALAQQDALIGVQQKLIAEDHLAVVKQEQEIAWTQQDNAQATVDFLANKFTGEELYRWMSGILSGIYSYFLQQATAMARLAQQQLAFERQQPLAGFIRADYWQPPSDEAVRVQNNGSTPDRRGLTGSASLLRDTHQLDEYAFATDRRKLQLVKTISLARLAPIEFHRFRQTGVLQFATPMELFNQDFPGHLLRLIKRVRMSMIALIPPAQGIRATLSTTGISYVVTEGSVGRGFERVPIVRDPESIALSSPLDATGLFALDAQGELLAPFENMGVEAPWVFELPRAANPFNFQSIADVLLTIEYTALSDALYRKQVIQELDNTIDGERLFSVRNELPDEWWRLHNPEPSEAAEPLRIAFETQQNDFPANVNPDLTIQQLTLYVVRAQGKTFEIAAKPTLTFPSTAVEPGNEAGSGAASTLLSGSVGGSFITSVDGKISTRSTSGAGWRPLTSSNIVPLGQWEIQLQEAASAPGESPPSPLVERFKSGDIEDIVFAISYAGSTPEWPA